MNEVEVVGRPGRCLRPRETWKWMKAKLPRKGLLKIYLLVFINMFSYAFSAAMLFPYLPFLTVFLIPRLQEDEKDVGKYIGFVAGSRFLGRAAGSYFWGILSDRKGRKPVLVASSVGMALFSLMFGFSVNFPMAVVSRFLLGCVNGLIATCKAVVSEVSDDSNHAIGISTVGASVGFGFIIGPAVAGAIADPLVQYNLTVTNPFLHSFLTRFPFSLPPIVSALLFTVSGVLTLFFLPETLGLKKSRKRSEINEMELAAIRSRLGVSDGVDQSQNSAQTSLREEEEGTDETRLLGGEEPDDSESRTSNLFISNPTATNGNWMGSVDLSAEEMMEGKTVEDKAEEGVGGKEEGIGGKQEEEETGTIQETDSSTVCSRRSRFLAILKNSLLDLRLFFFDCTCLNSLLIYCVFSFVAISYNEIFSLWAYTQPHYGGLGFSLHEISICLTIVGGLMLPGTLVAFPLVSQLEKWLQTIKTYFLVAISGTALVLVLPHVHYLFAHRLVLWVVLITLSVFINVAFTVGYSATFTFINNSTTLDKLGSINGVAMMMTSIARAVAPVIAGSLFSASLSDATLTFGFPVNYNLVFVVLSIVFMITVFMVACLPVSINKQKIIEDL